MFSPDELAMEMGVRSFGVKHTKLLAPVDNRGGWWPLVNEPYPGAWQNDDELKVDTKLSYYAVYACVTLIANDIGKLRPRLMEMDEDGIWTEVSSPAFSPVLRKPNRYQNHIQFKEWWAMSKLTRGNTYALKQRDGRGVVVAQYLLDPEKVTPLVSDDGAVWYQLKADNISGVGDDVVVPASEIIHDRMNCLFHPLVGVSPLFACGLAAAQGLAIQTQSRKFFGNGARPSGVLTAPGAISQETADRLKDSWATKFSGDNAGRVAILGDGLKYEPMMMTATDAQMIEQLRMTAEQVCAAFHVPSFKVGIGQMPTYQNGEMLNQIYYSDCLQSLIEQFELCQDEGLGIGEGVAVQGRTLGVDLDLDGLLRMDTATQIKTLGDAVKGSLITIDEARKKLDRKGVDGGDVIWSQQQNWPIRDLAQRPIEALVPGVIPSGATPEPDKPVPPPDDDAKYLVAASSLAKSLEAA
jgi:HK97 family phage portal protein